MLFAAGLGNWGETSHRFSHLTFGSLSKVDFVCVSITDPRKSKKLTGKLACFQIIPFSFVLSSWFLLHLLLNSSSTSRSCPDRERGHGVIFLPCARPGSRMTLLVNSVSKVWKSRLWPQLSTLQFLPTGWFGSANECDQIPFQQKCVSEPAY